MVDPVNSFINVVMIKQAQWFWSRLETTFLEDTLIKLGRVKILLISAYSRHNLRNFYIGAWKITTCRDSQANDFNMCSFFFKSKSEHIAWLNIIL